MGKGFRGGKRGGRGGGRSNESRDTRDNRETWNSIPFTPEDQNNAKFEEYYKAQQILPESEWPAFLESLRTELPTTFRVTGSRAHAQTISQLIHDTYVPTMQAVEHEDKVYGPPEQIDWYPEDLAWQLSAPKRIVRKSEPFKVFQRFLVGETEVGNLSRQEAVSMIPPLLLDVEPHHYCLDMCAAPGSKTAQILEALNPHHTSSTGLLIANDTDYKRTHMLVHQTGRMPSKGLMVTNCDASLFPHISLGDEGDLRFDRILADVPCSGDGTLRKNLEIWRKWGVADGNGLHGLQFRILKRAMDMLKPGGRLVYSTCSFNPIENEAVVAAGLKARKEFSIVDASSYLPKLKRRPGLNTWKVGFGVREGDETVTKWYDTYADYLADPLPDRTNSKDPWKVVSESMWPGEGVENMGLEKTMRLVPHDQNTGGFFVCVLEKAALPLRNQATGSGNKRALSPSADADREAKKEKVSTPTDEILEAAASDVPEPEAEQPTPDVSIPATPAVDATSAIPSASNKFKRRHDGSYREDPFAYASPEDTEVQSIVDFFRLKDSFPRGNVLVRNENRTLMRVAYLTNDVVKRVIENNDCTRLRLIFAGVKGFVRQDSQNRQDIPCKWRIPSEGVGEVLPHMGDGFVREMGEEGLPALRILVEHPYPPINLFPTSMQEWVNDTVMGNIIARFPAAQDANGKLAMEMVLPIWRAKSSLSLLIDKKEKSMLSLRTFGEDICKSMPTKHEKAQAEAAAAAAVEEEGGDVDEEALVAAGVGQAEEAASG